MFINSIDADFDDVLSLESEASKTLKETWETYLEQLNNKSLNQVNALFDQRDTFSIRERNRVIMLRNEYNNRYFSAVDETRKVPYGEVSNFFYTVDGWPSGKELIKQFSKESQLNEEMLNAYPKRISSAIEQLSNVLGRVCRLETSEEIQSNIFTYLHKKDHPTELFSKRFNYPAESYLMGLIIHKTTVDRTQERYNLNYIAQAASLPVVRVKGSMVSWKSSKSTDVAKVRSYIELKPNEVPQILDFSMDSLDKIQDFIGKECSVSTELDVLFDRVGKFIDLCDRLNDPELKVMGGKVLNYAASLVEQKYKLPMIRLKQLITLVDATNTFIRKAIANMS